MTINRKVRLELTRLKKEEGVRVPHKALTLAETLGRQIRRQTSSITEAAEFCIDLALDRKVLG